MKQAVGNLRWEHYHSVCPWSFNRMVYTLHMSSSTVSWAPLRARHRVRVHRELREYVEVVVVVVVEEEKDQWTQTRWLKPTGTCIFKTGVLGPKKSTSVLLSLPDSSSISITTHKKVPKCFGLLYIIIGSLLSLRTKASPIAVIASLLQTTWPTSFIPSKPHQCHHLVTINSHPTIIVERTKNSLNTNDDVYSISLAITNHIFDERVTSGHKEKVFCICYFLLCTYYVSATLSREDPLQTVQFEVCWLMALSISPSGLELKVGLVSVWG